MRNLSQRVTMIALGLLIALGVATQFSELESYSMERLNKLFDKDRSLANRTSGRSDLLEAGWRTFLTVPLTGIGPGSFPSVYAKISLQSGLGYGRGDSKAAHSGWIKTLTENGIFGFGLFLAWVLSFSVTGWRKRRQGLFSVGLLVTVVVSVALISTEFTSKGLWFLVAGGLVLLNQTQSNRTVSGQHLRRPLPVVPERRKMGGLKPT
jgi:O-antigen ligase